MSPLPRFHSKTGLAKALLGGAGGAVVWRGPSILDGAPLVVIASGLGPRGMANSKTGDVVQTWILRSDVSPPEATQSGQDDSICGECKHRGGPFKKRTCYVHLGMVGHLWKTFEAGGYPELPDLSFARAALFASRVVRLGSYGDPAFVPDELWEPAFRYSRGWIGYTHQWRERPDLRRFLMASVDSPREAEEARDLGMRYFRVSRYGEPYVLGKNEIACPATPEAGKRTTCEKCRLCDGARRWGDQRKDIVAMEHGPHVTTRERARKRRLNVLR